MMLIFDYYQKIKKIVVKLDFIYNINKILHFNTTDSFSE